MDVPRDHGSGGSSGRSGRGSGGDGGCPPFHFVLFVVVIIVFETLGRQTSMAWNSYVVQASLISQSSAYLCHSSAGI